MRVLVVGAGALGRLLAYRLAQGGATVSLLRHHEDRADEMAPVAVRLGKGKRQTVELPLCDEQAPADVTVLAVRSEQVDAQLCETLRAVGSPVVVWTPLLPAGHALLQAQDVLAVPAMPSVAVEMDETGTLSFWQPPLAPSLIQSRDDVPILAPLCEALLRGGMPVRLARSVAQRNWATTTAFFALQVGVCRAGGFPELLADKALFARTMRATRQCRQLARRLGSVDPAMLLISYVAPATRWLRPVLARAFPRASAYISRHFGVKLAAQHRTLFDELHTLARREGISVDELEQLVLELPAPDRETT